MIQTVMRFTGMIAALCAGAVLLIRAQPYDDTALRTLLFPPDCSLPCFLGIRPGITTAEEAVAILSDHPWVRAVHRPHQNITWEWNGMQPEWIGSQAIIRLEGETVEEISMFTRLVLGDIWLLQRPKKTLYTRTFDIRIYIYTTFYQDDGFQFQGTVQCPLRAANFWSARQSLQIPARRDSYMTEVRRSHVTRLDRILC